MYTFKIIPDPYIQNKFWSIRRTGKTQFSVNVLIREVPQYDGYIPCSKQFVNELIGQRFDVINQLVSIQNQGMAYCDSAQARARCCEYIKVLYKEKKDLNTFLNPDSLVRKVELTAFSEETMIRKRKSIIDNALRKSNEHKNR